MSTPHPEPVNPAVLEAWALRLCSEIFAGTPAECAYVLEEAHQRIAAAPDHELALVPALLALQYAVTALIDDVSQADDVIDLVTAAVPENVRETQLRLVLDQFATEGDPSPSPSQVNRALAVRLAALAAADSGTATHAAFTARARTLGYIDEEGRA